jgi:AdoMet-dependent heme synthase
MRIPLPTALPTRSDPVRVGLLDASAPPPPALRLVFWETTTGCNLACVHCRRLEVSRELSRDDLTTAQAKAFIRSIAETGRPILVFSGGEPLMRPDLFELAETAREAGLPTALATNGTLLDAATAQRVVDAGFRRASISFDGPDALIHDRFRGAGSFDAAVGGFRALRRAGLSMQINTTITRDNHRRLDDTYRLAMDLGAEALHLFMLVPVGCGMELSPEVMLDSQEYEAALNWIYDRSLEGKLHLKATCAPHYFRILRQRAKTSGRRVPTHHPSPITHHAAAASGNMTAMTKGCLAGQAVCFVSHTGEVFPCGYLPVSSGNVKQTPLATIWRQSSVFADLRDDSKLEGKCGLCEYRKVCMGCRARAFGFTGNYLAEEPNCSHIPVRAR